MGTIRKPLYRRILRGIVSQVAARSVATIFYLHYGALCFCAGVIIGANNPYYNLWTVLKIAAFVSTGFAIAGLLQAATDYQESASRPRRTRSQQHEDYEVFVYYRNDDDHSSARVYDYDRDAALDHDR